MEQTKNEDERCKNHWSWLLCIGALGFSVVALVLVFCRIEPIAIDWIGVLVGILSFITMILIGFHVFNYIDFDRKIKNEVRRGVEKGKADIRGVLHRKNALIMADFYLGFTSLFFEARKGVEAFSCTLSAISCYVEGNDLSSAQEIMTEFINDNMKFVRDNVMLKTKNAKKNNKANPVIVMKLAPNFAHMISRRLCRDEIAPNMVLSFMSVKIE